MQFVSPFVYNPTVVSSGDGTSYYIVIWVKPLREMRKFESQDNAGWKSESLCDPSFARFGLSILIAKRSDNAL